MNKIEQVISQQLAKLGYTNIEFIEIYKAPARKDGKGNPFYEKWRLLTIFKRKLKAYLHRDKENDLVGFLQNAISKLETIPDNEEIYYWRIRVKDKSISGRSTKQLILHIYPWQGKINKPSTPT